MRPRPNATLRKRAIATCLSCRKEIKRKADLRHRILVHKSASLIVEFLLWGAHQLIEGCGESIFHMQQCLIVAFDARANKAVETSLHHCAFWSSIVFLHQRIQLVGNLVDVRAGFLQFKEDFIARFREQADEFELLIQPVFIEHFHGIRHHLCHVPVEGS